MSNANQPPPYPGPQQDDKDRRMSSGAAGKEPHVAIVTKAPDLKALEEQQAKGDFAFDDQSVRRSFIRKVFLIVGAQLAVATAVVALFTLHPGARELARSSPLLYGGASAVFLGTYIGMACCCQSLMRSFPANFIILAVFTLSLSVVAGMAAALAPGKAVLVASAVTVVCVAALVLFATQTAFDITKYSGVLFAVCVGLTVMALLLSFASFGLMGLNTLRTLHLVFAGLGAMMFMAFLVYDVQLVMGRGEEAIDQEDFVFAAAQIFVDIVYIFMYILRIAAEYGGDCC